MTLGFLVILLSVIMSVMLGRLGTTAPALPESFILELPLRGDFVEHQNQPGGYSFGPRALTIRQAVDTIERAGRDPRVRGIAAQLHGGGYNLAHLDELRRAVKTFRKSGKPAVIYAPSYGDSGGGLVSYFLAAAFDEIWMQPMGVLSVPGLRAEVPFGREMLEKIGVTPQFFARKEYKSVFESAMESEMSPASREMTAALVGDLAAYLSAEIADDRDIDMATLMASVDKGILLDYEALEAGLIDRLGYFDELTGQIRAAAGTAKGGKEMPLVEFARYVRVIEGASSSFALSERAKLRQERAPKVALIYLAGTILSGGALEKGSLSDADAVAIHIHEAAKDKDVRAIVLRIDSPGGSPAAAETVRHAVVQARKSGKMVIVSMGSAAASGGYWAAAPADYIFASPATLTGSIGVAGGKISLDNLWDRIGVNWDAVSWGGNSDIWSLNEPFSPQGEARINAMMDNVYDGFIARVAEGRAMSLAEVDEIARGRVWTGRQALERGLVDELGGLDSALEHTARILGESRRSNINVQLMPRPKTALEIFSELMDYQVSMGQFAPAQSRIWSFIEPLVTRYEMTRRSDYVTVYQPLSLP